MKGKFLTFLVSPSINILAERDDGQKSDSEYNYLSGCLCFYPKREVLFSLGTYRVWQYPLVNWIRDQLQRNKELNILSYLYLYLQILTSTWLVSADELKISLNTTLNNNILCVCSFNYLQNKIYIVLEYSKQQP